MKSWVSSAFGDTEILVSGKHTRSQSRNTCANNVKSTIASQNVPKISKSNNLTNKENSNQSQSGIINLESFNSKKLEQNINVDLASKYEPKSRAELVVHKNKIDQLNNILDDCLNKPKGSIILIEGPAGCGKYTTLKVLCKEKNIGLNEWDQSILNLKSLNSQEATGYSFETPVYDSQVKVFSQFLFKSSRYTSDQIFKTSNESSNSCDNAKILFVKEIPNFAYRDPKVFLNLLNEFKKFSKYSLIFSLTQTTYSTELNPQKIFSNDTRKDLKIIEICFNSFANTYLNKHIERIAKGENYNFVDKKFMENLCLTCNGDLRNAINLLELFSTQPKKTFNSNVTNEKSSIKRKAGSRKPLDDESNSQSNYFGSSFKDQNFSIFRGLGKILHRKNLDSTNSNDERFNWEKKLPKHLMKKYERPPLASNPDEIYDKLPLSSDSIMSYLHQNYADIFNVKSSSADFDQKFDALNAISENFINSDIINKKSCLFEISTSGNQETKLKEISAEISIRSILFNFYFASSETKIEKSSNKSLWMPLYKPFNSKLMEAKQKRKKIAQDFINSLVQSDSKMIHYLNEMNKGIFIEFIPFIQLRLQLRANSKANSNDSSYLKVQNTQEFSLLFTKYKPLNTKTGQTTENDYDNEDQNENLDSKFQNQNICSNSSFPTGNYVYEDPLNLKIDDYNF